MLAIYAVNYFIVKRCFPSGQLTSNVGYFIDIFPIFTCLVPWFAPTVTSTHFDFAGYLEAKDPDAVITSEQRGGGEKERWGYRKETVSFVGGGVGRISASRADIREGGKESQT